MDTIAFHCGFFSLINLIVGIVKNDQFPLCYFQNNLITLELELKLGHCGKMNACYLPTVR